MLLYYHGSLKNNGNSNKSILLFSSSGFITEKVLFHFWQQFCVVQSKQNRNEELNKQTNKQNKNEELNEQTNKQTNKTEMKS